MPYKLSEEAVRVNHQRMLATNQIKNAHRSLGVTLHPHALQHTSTTHILQFFAIIHVVLSIAYSSDGTRLFTISNDGALVSYGILNDILSFNIFDVIDTGGKYRPVHVIPTQNRDPYPSQLAVPFQTDLGYVAYHSRKIPLYLF